MISSHWPTPTQFLPCLGGLNCENYLDSPSLFLCLPFQSDFHSYCCSQGLQWTLCPQVYGLFSCMISGTPKSSDCLPLSRATALHLSLLTSPHLSDLGIEYQVPVLESFAYCCPFLRNVIQTPVFIYRYTLMTTKLPSPALSLSLTLTLHIHLPSGHIIGWAEGISTITCPKQNSKYLPFPQEVITSVHSTAIHPGVAKDTHLGIMPFSHNLIKFICKLCQPSLKLHLITSHILASTLQSKSLSSLTLLMQWPLNWSFFPFWSFLSLFFKQVPRATLLKLCLVCINECLLITLR